MLLPPDAWFGHGRWALAAAPLRIFLVVVLAVVVRVALYRLVGRLVRKATEGTVPGSVAGSPGASPLLSERRRQRAGTIGSVLRSVSSVVIAVVAGSTILGELGVNLAPILASAGIVGVAVGFGAQNLVKDFLSGMFMILEDQYGIGDVIDAGTATGTVEAVGLRTTRVRAADGTVWYLRNGEIARIGNKSQGWSRAVVDISVAATADLTAAGTLLKQAADEVWHDPAWRDVVLDEPQLLGVESLGPDSAVLRVALRTAPLQEAAVARAVRSRIQAGLEAGGIALK